MKNKIENYLIVAVIIWACFMVFTIINYLIPIYLSIYFNENTQTIENENIEEIKIFKTLEPYNEPFYELKEEERYLIESIVAGESGSEPYLGKVAVANCILNACIKDNIRPEEVQNLYKYSGYKDIEEFETECIEAYGNTNLSDEVREAVSQVFDNGEVLSNEILWFYAPKYSSGKWHQTQKFVIEISNHRFYAPWN